MGRQMFLFKEPNQDVVDEIVSTDVRILGWNIQSPSRERAERQLEWLEKSGAHVLLLTEAKNTEGSLYLISKLESCGYVVFFAVPPNNEYSTAICVKGFPSEGWDLKLGFLPDRLQSVTIDTFLGRLRLIGLYPPSYWRGETEDSKRRRRRFHDQVGALLEELSRGSETSQLVVGGDLNVLEPGHEPHIPAFEDYYFYEKFLRIGMIDAFRTLHPQQFEYSWFDPGRVGQRLDHFFTSKDLSANVNMCYYEHQPRYSNLSDHSAMWLMLK